MLLFSTQQDRLKQTETVKVGQSARCVCVYPSFFTTLQTSTSSFVYIHSRFCAQLRVQCAMDCHWDDKSLPTQSEHNFSHRNILPIRSFDFAWHQSTFVCLFHSENVNSSPKKKVVFLQFSVFKFCPISRWLCAGDNTISSRRLGPSPVDPAANSSS
jgi:hypothetical protein